jgi:DNA repair photolyase
MPDQRKSIVNGRGAQIAPKNRFESTHREDDFEQLEADDELLQATRSLPTEYIDDDSQSVVTENNSPDVGFRFSLNPYRGCSHGCSYCYARPTHEYLGLNAGLDFESKVFVKRRAPELFRRFLARESWEPQFIAFSGVTDCYQPAEREFRLTRGCLEVALDARQPVGVITKNALVTRDLDVLQQMAELDTISVSLSITTLNESLARTMEPQTSSPPARLRAIRELREAGIRANVMVAPIIPGLNDSEIPAILEAAADAGACSASYILLRLPLNVLPIFEDWLDRTQPLKKERVLAHVRDTRDGELSDSQFGRRMRGVGPVAEQIQQTFRVFAKKFGLDANRQPLSVSHFRRPSRRPGQMRLF